MYKRQEQAGATRTAAPLYLRHESHWSRKGSQSFADEIARQIPELPRNDAVIEAFDGPPFRTSGSLSHVGVSMHHPAYQWTTTQNDPSLMLLPLGREGRMDSGVERAEILLAGSSFSAGFFARAVLASTLQTPVADSSLRGQQPLVSMSTGLLAYSPADTPRFVITEFPVFQAAFAKRQTVGTARACVLSINHLDAQSRAIPLPNEWFPERVDRPSDRRRIMAQLPGGTLLSSGDAALSLRITVEAKTATSWRVLSDGMVLKLQLRPGKHVRMVPFVESNRSTGAFQMEALDADSIAADVTVDVTTDANLAAAVRLHGQAEDDGTWTYVGPTAVESHESIVLRWKEAPDALDVRASGTDATGAPFSRKWSFQRVAGSRIAIFSLGALGEAVLENLTIEGGNSTMAVALAPLMRSQ